MHIFVRHLPAGMRGLFLAVASLAGSGPVIGADCLQTEPYDSRYQTLIYRMDGKVAGTLVRPMIGECKTLKVFFPGQAQELGIFSSSVPENRRVEWGRVLLEGPAYSLAPSIVKAGCPVLLLGQSRISVPPDALLGLLAETGATGIELISHSAGYIGLTSQLRSLQGSPMVDRIRALKLLDNYYDRQDLPGAIGSVLGADRAARICTGFYTAHNAQRYRASYQALCPGSHVRSDHKAPVKEFFE